VGRCRSPLTTDRDPQVERERLSPEWEVLLFRVLCHEFLRQDFEDWSL
jgi:hypothetical protein